MRRPERSLRAGGANHEKIAAVAEGEPCVTYIGADGAGHYVKMVHNGIEYGDMQLIAEAYSLLKQALNLSNEQLAETFAEWNKGELNSYLIDITKDIFTKKDEEGKYRRCDPGRSRQQRHRQVDQPELIGSG